MTTPRDSGGTWGPIALGLATLVGVLAVIEAMIRIGWINAFIVPLPSAVLLSFERIIVEEGVLKRFLSCKKQGLISMRRLHFCANWNVQT